MPLKTWLSLLSICAALSSATPAFAWQSTPASNPAEQDAPRAPPVLSLRERAKLQDQWLAQRLDTIVPALMREHRIDMWVLIAREYVEDPVIATMLDAESMHARRRTILIFYDAGRGRPVERLTISRYPMANLFKSAWKPEEEPDQWRQLAKVINERQPKQIAINSSDLTQFADGLTLSQYEGLIAALPADLRQRVVRSDKLAVGWLETRTAEEMKVYSANCPTGARNHCRRPKRHGHSARPHYRQGCGLVVSREGQQPRSPSLVPAVVGDHASG